MLRDGRVQEAAAALPDAVQRAVDGVRDPAGRRAVRGAGGGELAAAGLGPRELGAAVRSGQLVRIAEGDLPARRARRRRPARGWPALPQPFTLSQARQAWGTSRRVAVPLDGVARRPRRHRPAARRHPPPALSGAEPGLGFTGEVWEWRGPAPFHFVTVPAGQSAVLHELAAVVSYGWGMVPVRARIGGTGWRTSLWPGDDGYVLPLKAAVRRAEGIELGDTVAVQLDVEAGMPR